MSGEDQKRKIIVMGRGLRQVTCNIRPGRTGSIPAEYRCYYFIADWHALTIEVRNRMR